MSHRRRRYRAKPKNQIDVKRPPANEEIDAAEVRLIGPAGEQLGVVSMAEAQKMAEEAESDLVAVAANSNPPVVRIMDLGKHMYEQRKKQAKQKAKTKGGETKGIRLTFKMAAHDQEVRLRQATAFLEEGNRIKLEMRLRGREKGMLDHAEKKIREFIALIPGAAVDGNVSKTGNSISANVFAQK